MFTVTSSLANKIARIFECSLADNDPEYRELTDINDEFVKLKTKIAIAPNFGEVNNLIWNSREIIEIYE